MPNAEGSSTRPNRLLSGGPAGTPDAGLRRARQDPQGKARVVKLRGFKVYQGTETVGYHYWCPGCDEPHAVNVKEYMSGVPVWKFNGNVDRPTFSPSVLVHRIPKTDTYKGHPQCHVFITDGRIQFLSDCEHALAGQTVDLPDWPEHFG